MNKISIQRNYDKYGKLITKLNKISILGFWMQHVCRARFFAKAEPIEVPHFREKIEIWKNCKRPYLNMDVFPFYFSWILAKSNDFLGIFKS